MLALVPASIIGRGYAKSANVQAAIEKIDTPIAVEDSITPANSLHGWHLYEIGGQPLFAVYAASGGLSVRYMAYLVRWTLVLVESGHLSQYNADGGDLGHGTGAYWARRREVIPMEFSYLDFLAVAWDVEAVKKILNAKIKWALKNRKPRIIDEHGDMGVTTPEEREQEAAWMRAEAAKHTTGFFPKRYGA